MYSGDELENYLEYGEDSSEILPLEICKNPRIEDVVGTSRKFIDDFILSKENEEVFYSMGVQPDKTFLLAGKPGTGKTMAIKAINNSLNKELFEMVENFRTREKNSVEFNPEENPKSGLVVLPWDIGKYGTAYINEGSRNIENFFERAYSVAEVTGGVLISLDEADAVLNSRTQSYSNHNEDRKVLETFMKHLQISHDTPGIYVVLMSNLPELCDEASLRAGRIDKRYKFELPSLEERICAYKKIIEKKNELAGYSVIRKYFPEKLGELSAGFSYADITQSVERTIRKRAKEISLKRKHRTIPQGYVTEKRLENSIKIHKGEFNLEKRRGIGFQ
jgi:SpoVK/Ycf46/Vps4 family AAA+-type ATPase